MKKSEFRMYPVGSSLYVLAHAKWRASRGKRPSATLSRSPWGPLRNPREALEFAPNARDPIWTLRGRDSFDGTNYPLPGQFFDEASAVKAAKKRCFEVEESQPSSESGGQGFGGIQDMTFVVHPNGHAAHVRL